MKTVSELLKQKASGVITIGPNATVRDAVKLLADKRVGAVLMLEGGRLAGIFSERDLARITARMEPSLDTPVRNVMTKQVVYVTLAQTNEECMALMTEKRIRHLPVIDEGNLVGVLSIGDLVKDIISEQQFIIDQLVTYIHR